MRVITGYLGQMLLLLGAMLSVPVLYSVLSHEDGTTTFAFTVTAVLSLLAGTVLFITRDRRSPSTAQGMVICSLSWAVLSAFGSLPFILALNTSPMNALFESVSGFTTTGITVFTGLEELPRSILLWRSISQWVGGLGILTFFMAVASKTPGAHRLIEAESHKIFAGRPVPGLMHTVRILWTIYGSFTVAVAIAYLLAGMSIFDAVNHALTTIATGGFSTHDASMGWFAGASTGNHVLIEYIAVVGMLAGGVSFLVHYRVFAGDGPLALFRGSEMRLFWGIILVSFLFIGAEQVIASGFWEDPEPALRKNLFQTISMLTTTGYATEELTSPFFGAAARQLFLMMMVIGGCVGSTSGGIKVLRVSILLSGAREEISKLFRAERAVSGIRFQGRLIGRNELSRITGIVFLWFLLLGVGGLATALLTPGMHGYTAFSGMFSALGNIGPSLMSQQQVVELHWAVKTVYIAGMLAGRLEILPVLLLFSGKAWR